jgi:hypothetical protein
MKRNAKFALLSGASAICIFAAFSAQAANFTVTNAQTTTQSIGGGADETGIVEAGGSVATVGNNNVAVTSSSAGGTLINYGSLSTTGNSSYGLRTTAASNILTNSGTVTTSGFGSYGLFATGANNSILTNTGTITTTGLQGFGLSTFNANTLINSGNITTNGDQAYGIYSSGANASLTNNGTVVTHGLEGHGMYGAAGNITLMNNGSVIVTGTDAYGVRVINNNSTFTNAGYVKSVASNTIVMSGNNATLILKPNSTVDGTVVFSGAGRTLQYDVSGTGRAGSVTHITGTVTGSPTTSITNTSLLPSGAQVVQGGNTVAVVTPDQFGSSQQLINQTVTDAGNVLNNRQQLALLGDTTEAAGGTQYAASTSMMNDGSHPNAWAVRDRKVAWAEGFGSYQERGQTSDTSDSTARSGGVMAGVDLPQTSEGVRSGFYTGGFSGNLNVGETTFRSVDSTGGMAGGYVGKSYGEYYVSGQLGLGFSSNESDRYTGVDTASADYNSYFVSPSLTVMRPIKDKGVTWIPNATLRYTAQFNDSYNETGSITNQNVGSHTSNSLDGRLMLDARFDPMKLEQDRTLHPSLRAGIQGQTLLGSNSVDVTTLGNNLSFDPKGGDGYVDGIIGINLSQTTDAGGPELYLDGEANLGLNKDGPSDNKGIVGRLGAKWTW